jgi:single-strand DNA-binding protein
MVNHVVLVGNLGSDPEVRAVNERQKVTRLSVATHDTITKRIGERERRTEWHEVVVWGSLGERAAEHLRKGGRVLVEGQLHTRVWADFRGTKHITAEVHAKRVLSLGGERSGGDVADDEERLVNGERSQDGRPSSQDLRPERGSAARPAPAS